MSTTDSEENESVLDISEQTNRPPDVALAQQRIQAWHPVLDPLWVIIGLFYLGAILVPVGKFQHATGGWGNLGTRVPNSLTDAVVALFLVHRLEN